MKKTARTVGYVHMQEKCWTSLWNCRRICDQITVLFIVFSFLTVLFIVFIFLMQLSFLNEKSVENWFLEVNEHFSTNLQIFTFCSRISILKRFFIQNQRVNPTKFVRFEAFLSLIWCLYLQHTRNLAGTRLKWENIYFLLLFLFFCTSRTFDFWWFSWTFSGSRKRFSGSRQRFPELACRRRNTCQFRKLCREPEKSFENRQKSLFSSTSTKR